MWRELGYFDQAIVDFEDAIRLDSNNHEAHSGRGQMFLMIGDFNRAIADYTTAINIDSGVLEYYKNRGVARGTIGDHQDALRDLDMAVQLDEADQDNIYDADLFATRAITRMYLGMKAAALADAEEAEKYGADRAQLNRSLMAIQQENKK